MPKKKTSATTQTNITVGDISGINGELNIAGGNITTHHTTTTTGLSAAEIKQLFDGLNDSIDNRPNTPPVVKEDLKSEMKVLQSSVTDAASKKQKIDEGFLASHFRSIARMAPDILDVVVAALANPLGGLGVAVAKIAQKAKEDTGNS